MSEEEYKKRIQYLFEKRRLSAVELFYAQIYQKATQEIVERVTEAAEDMAQFQTFQAPKQRPKNSNRKSIDINTIIVDAVKIRKKYASKEMKVLSHIAKTQSEKNHVKRHNIVVQQPFPRMNWGDAPLRPLENGRWVK